MVRRDVDTESEAAHAPAHRRDSGCNVLARAAVFVLCLSLLPSSQGYRSSGALGRPAVWGGTDPVDSVLGGGSKPSGLDIAGGHDHALRPARSRSSPTPGVVQVDNVYGLRRCQSLRGGMHMAGKGALHLPAHSPPPRRLKHHDLGSQDVPQSYTYEGCPQQLTRIQTDLYPFLQF
ncbi:hypothetical protein T484DRAFT_1908420 [Baffinella frigidus]|nr:hypothetical protein T484DRAFT_1908420 [Cryptophyta sp. CCMP2293]